MRRKFDEIPGTVALPGMPEPETKPREPVSRDRRRPAPTVRRYTRCPYCSNGHVAVLDVDGVEQLRRHRRTMFSGRTEPCPGSHADAGRLR